MEKGGNPSLVGIVTRTIAGLAIITTASGFVGPVRGIGIGLVGGFICYYAVGIVKDAWYLDDSLDVFAFHSVGGILGTLLVAIFANETLGGLGIGEKSGSMEGQFVTQVIGVVATAAWTASSACLICRVAGVFAGGLRAREDEITEGLDLSYHGEPDYNF